MKVCITTAAAVLALSLNTAYAQKGPPAKITDPGPEEHLTFLPADIQWKDGPPTFEKGSQFAVLEGDPSKPGVFTMRFRFPDGFRIAPHWHPNVERITVLSGSFHLGSGEKFDEKAMTALEAGAYTAMPREMRHYALAKGETIVQLTSVGPWEIVYVNPKDDPRKRK